MSTTSITIADATNLVSKFKAQAKGDQSTDKGASEKFTADKRARLDARLARAYGTSVSLLGMEAAEFGKFCVQQGTFAPGEDENPFSACVRILFGSKKDGKIVPDKSAWKYSKCFRAAQSLGWTEENFAEQLGKYKLSVTNAEGKEKKLGRLIALETLDTRKHGDPEAQQQRYEDIAARTWLNSVSTPLAVIPGLIRGSGSPEDGSMIGAVLQWNKARQAWAVRGVHTTNPDKAWNLVSKAIIEEFRTWLDGKRKDDKIRELATAAPEDLDDLLAALEQQNREVRSAEIEHRIAQKVSSGDMTVEGMSSPVTDSQAA